MLSRSFAAAPISWRPTAMCNGNDHNRRCDIVNAIDERIGEHGQQASAVGTVHGDMRLRKIHDSPQATPHLVEKAIAQPWTAVVIPFGGADELSACRGQKSNLHCVRRFVSRFLASANTVSASCDVSSPARYLAQRRSASAAHASFQVSEGSWKLTSNASMSSACSSADSLRASAISCLTCWFMGSNLARRLASANALRLDVEEGART
jgi:hypothetical protein